MRKKRCQSVREVLEALKPLVQTAPETEKVVQDRGTAPVASEETTYTIPRKQPAAGRTVKVDVQSLKKWLLRLMAVLAVLGGMFVSDFTRYFTEFHHIFFNNDLWLFDPATSRLINIVPEAFWSRIALR